MFHLRLRSLAAVAIGVASSCAHAAIQWTGPGSNGHYYQLTGSAGTWADAQQAAIAAGGHLVDIASAEENAFLVSTFLLQPQDVFWIGFTDRVTEGNFQWTTGAPVSYTNWNPGEPNEGHDGVSSPEGEDYAAIGWHFAQGFTTVRGTWNDLPNIGCSASGCPSPQLLPGIIEFDVSPVPEPSAPLLVLCGLAVVTLAARGRKAALGAEQANTR